MQLELNTEEAALLDKQLKTRVSELESMLVRTDAPRMQHELNKEVEALHRIEERLSQGISASSGVWTRVPSHP